MVSLENALNVDIHYKKKKSCLKCRHATKKKKRFCIPFVSPCTAWYGLPKKPKIVL